MCEKPATSKEHVPPKCFFPLKKDSPKGVNLRMNLITVPSCDQHNSQKSGDDEYFRMVILSHIENNLFAQRHFSKPVKRSFMRKPNLLNLFKDLKPVYDSQGYLQAAIFTVDQNRFNNEIDQMVRALYFYTYGEKWLGDVRTICNALKMRSYENFLGAAQYNVELNVAFSQIRKLLNPEEKIGDNPSVFYFQIFREEAPDPAIAMRLVFYEGVEIIAILSNEQHL
jgi:hypothetical protein